MKSGRLRKSFVQSGLVILVIFAALITNSGCEASPRTYWDFPVIDIIVVNQTDQALTVYWDIYKIGEVGPGERITIDGLGLELGKYPIKAINAQGETVFSETYTFNTNDKYHLEKIEERVYKAVIPPLQSK